MHAAQTSGLAAFVKSSQATPASGNENMTAAVTAADGDAACTTGIAALSVGSVRVFIGDLNGSAEYSVGNAVSTGVDCFFATAGAPTVALANNNVPSGAILHWNGSVAGFQLDATYKVTFSYLT